jgi:hypothetical protein
MARHIVSTSSVIVGLFASLVATADAQGRGRSCQSPRRTGKDLVQATCSRCHGLGMVANDGTPSRNGSTSYQRWSIPIKRYGDHHDISGAHFPDKPKPQAVIVPGNARVAFKEWSRGQRAHVHSPLATPDGGLGTLASSPTTRSRRHQNGEIRSIRCQWKAPTTWADRRRKRKYLVHSQPRATSASSIRRRARSPSKLPEVRAIRTHRSSINRAYSGSPQGANMVGRLIRKRVTSRSSRHRRPLASIWRGDDEGVPFS